jgi:hypothetical protein
MKTTTKIIITFFAFYYGISSLAWIPTSYSWNDFVTSGPVVLIVGLLSITACVSCYVEENN